MTTSQFYAWVETQPSSKFELIDGFVVAMAAERVGHARVKAAMYVALRAAIRAAGVPCEAFMDGLAVEVGERTAYEPDALVNCGEPPAADLLFAPSPVIVVEVTSPSTGRIDAVRKFADYFRVPSIRHYLIVDGDARVVLHHRKDGDGRIQTSIPGTGPLALDPPGITLRVEDLFEPG
jgi:Uma2 family endonuclease